MMRWLMLAVVVVAASAAATYFLSSQPTRDDETAGTTAPAGSRGKDEGPPPVAVVDHDLTHHFKVMALETKDTHKWVIKNEGKGDLTLIGGELTCSCTVLDLKPRESKTLKPGEQFKLTVQWTPKAQGAFKKSARVLTNDPKKPVLDFQIEGMVQPAIVTLPGETIDMMQVSNDADHDSFLMLYSPDRPDVKITSMASSRPDLLEVSEVPLTDEEQKRLASTKGPKIEKGHKIRIRAKPSSSLGPFNEVVVIQTDHPLKSEVRQVVMGRIVGPISVTPESVRMHNVVGKRGGETTATIWVQGNERTKFDVEKAPQNLKVAIAPVDLESKGDPAAKSHAYRMTVTILPGTPPGIIHEPIVLKTDNPKAHELKVEVYIQVLGET